MGDELEGQFEGTKQTQADIEGIPCQPQQQSVLQVDWNIREVIGLALKVHDALMSRQGKPIPLHPEEIAEMLALKHFFDNSLKYVYRRCFCNKVYCRSPEKNLPCVFTAESLVENPEQIAACRYRGKPV